jgi:hypothetical protein
LPARGVGAISVFMIILCDMVVPRSGHEAMFVAQSHRKSRVPQWVYSRTGKVILNGAALFCN